MNKKIKIKIYSISLSIFISLLIPLLGHSFCPSSGGGTSTTTVTEPCEKWQNEVIYINANIKLFKEFSSSIANEYNNTFGCKYDILKNGVEFKKSFFYNEYYTFLDNKISSMLPSGYFSKIKMESNGVECESKIFGITDIQKLKGKTSSFKSTISGNDKEEYIVGLKVNLPPAFIKEKNSNKVITIKDFIYVFSCSDETNTNNPKFSLPFELQIKYDDDEKVFKVSDVGRYGTLVEEFNRTLSIKINNNLPVYYGPPNYGPPNRNGRGPIMY